MASILNLPPKTNAGLPRVDGPLKVSGVAMYTSDHNFPGMLYAVPVCATIANGAITAIDTSRVYSCNWRSPISRMSAFGSTAKTEFPFSKSSRVNIPVPEAISATMSLGCNPHSSRSKSRTSPGYPGR